MSIEIKEWDKEVYHVKDTIKHVSTLQQLFINLLDKIDEPYNLLNFIKERSECDEFVSKSYPENTLGTILRNGYNKQVPYLLKDLGCRILSHDYSKLAGAEYYGYKNVVYKLAGLEYGTPEHKKAIAELDEPFVFHYSVNSHHVEYYDNGILDFDIFDLIEMILDWCSACVCRGFDFRLSSVKKNQDKMGFDDDLFNIIVANIKLILPSDKIIDDLKPKQKALVISAFPACGKSHCFKHGQDKYKILDSDSSHFSWIKDGQGNNTDQRDPNFPANYIQHIKDNMYTADIIFVSSHDIVREALHKANIETIMVYPDYHLKDEWLRRMEERGNDHKFLDFISTNWDKFIETLHKENYGNVIIKQVLMGKDSYLNMELVEQFIQKIKE